MILVQLAIRVCLALFYVLVFNNKSMRYMYKHSIPFQVLPVLHLYDVRKVNKANLNARQSVDGRGILLVIERCHQAEG